MRTTLLKTDYWDLTHTNLPLPNMGNAGGLQPSTVDGTFFLNLHSAFPTAAGTFAGTVLAYTGYAEQTVVRTTAGWTVSGATVENDAIIAFGAKTGGADVFARWLSVSGTTGANMFWCGPLALAGSARAYTAVAATDVLTIPNIAGMSLIVGSEVVILTPTFGLLPAGLTEGANYFVASISGNDITVEATLGGGAIDITAAGSGIIFTHVPIEVTTTPSITPEIPIGALDFVAAL